MKRILSIAVLLWAVRVFGAIVPTGSEVDTNGWMLKIYFSNADTNGLFNFGFGTNGSGISNFKVTFTTTGFDDLASVVPVTNNAYGTKQLRLPYGVGGQGGAGTNYITYATPNGSGIIAWIALSKWITSTDSNITLNITSGAYSNCTAVTGLTVTNNSSAVHLKSFLQWTWPGWNRVTGNTLTLRGMAFHKSARLGRPVRVVAFSWQDQHGNGGTNLVTTMSVPDYTLGDAVPFSEYVANLNIASATNGDLLKCDVTAYPWVGDSGSVVSTYSSGYTLPTAQLASQTNECDRLNSMGFTCAIVDATNGVDATGVAVAGPLNFASPPLSFKTLPAATFALTGTNMILNGRSNLSSCVMYLTNGTYTYSSLVSSAGTNNWSWFTITNHPTSAIGSVVFTAGSGSGFKAAIRTKFCGLSVTNPSGADMFQTQTYLWVHRMDFIGPGSSSEWWNTFVGYATGNSFRTSYTGIAFKGFSSGANQWALVRGNTFTNSLANHTFCYVGNKGPTTLVDSTGGAPTDPSLVYNNLIIGIPNTKDLVTLSRGVTNGFAFIQNVVEGVGASQSRIAFDGNLDGMFGTNVIHARNTEVGCNTTLHYNDNAANKPYKYGCVSIGELCEVSDTKCDNNITPFNSNRTNNWSYHWLVESRNNLNMVVNSHGFLPDGTGLNTLWFDGTVSQFRFVNNAGQYGTATGYGNYHIKSDSVAVMPSLSDAMEFAYDIEGVPRGGFDPPGAYASASPRKGAGFFH